MTLPCDQRSDEDLLADLNAALEDNGSDEMDLVVGILWSLIMWGAIALAVLR